MLVSPHATNEDLAVARRFLDALGSTQAGFALVRGRKDALLIKEEKAANAAGARALGFEDAAPLLDRVRGGAVEALHRDGPRRARRRPTRARRAALDGVDTLVLLDTHRSQLERSRTSCCRRASPRRSTARSPTSRDSCRRVQPAVEPAFEARAEGEALWRLGAAARPAPASKRSAIEPQTGAGA